MSLLQAKAKALLAEAAARREESILLEKTYDETLRPGMTPVQVPGATTVLFPSLLPSPFFFPSFVFMPPLFSFFSLFVLWRPCARAGRRVFWCMRVCAHPGTRVCHKVAMITERKTVRCPLAAAMHTSGGSHTHTINAHAWQKSATRPRAASPTRRHLASGCAHAILRSTLGCSSSRGACRPSVFLL